jgi:predicted metal-dependent peptidase
MGRKNKSRKTRESELALRAFKEAGGRLWSHTLFSFFMRDVNLVHGDLCPHPGWAIVTSNGRIHVNASGYADPEDWLYVLAHSIAHLGFGHFKEREHPVLWNAACDCLVIRFLDSLKVGRLPDSRMVIDELPGGSEDSIYQRFVNAGGVPPELSFLVEPGPGFMDMLFEPPDPIPSWSTRRAPDWQANFARGIAAAVTQVVDEAANIRTSAKGSKEKRTPLEQARKWIMSSYPLLGALAAGITLVEDPVLCGRMNITIAAVNAEMHEIYFNPAFRLSEKEVRFVLAHELLHLGLSHHTRCRGRDDFLWNVACDYVINGWLVEMEIGELPHGELLYDPELKGLSAESIYERIVTDMRRFRKLRTFRGIGLGDMFEGGRPGWWETGRGLDLDSFYRRSLAQGLEFHERTGRGYLPAGLVEEIRALGQPPIPWDVELARWFDDLFPPIEKRLSYARPSRRQASAPDIPRPSWVLPHGVHEGRTFGVILDTSGSMDRTLLAKALGAIASYSMSRDVLMARVVFCDATYYDQGYMSPEAIADRVRVKGRGGTVLQPAVDFLNKAEDFPQDGPLLIITDGECDVLRIFRKHAFLIPRGRHLPFTPRGPVFHIE